MENAILVPSDLSHGRVHRDKADDLSVLVAVLHQIGFTVNLESCYYPMIEVERVNSEARLLHQLCIRTAKVFFITLFIPHVPHRNPKPGNKIGDLLDDREHMWLHRIHHTVGREVMRKLQTGFRRKESLGELWRCLCKGLYRKRLRVTVNRYHVATPVGMRCSLARCAIGRAHRSVLHLVWSAEPYTC